MSDIPVSLIFIEPSDRRQARNMTTNDDIRAAAERWRLHKQRPDEARSPYYAGLFDQDHEKKVLFLKDVELLVDAYLAEHPADDDKPVTEEWLKTTALKYNGMGLWTTHAGLQVADVCQRPGDHVLVVRLRADRYVIKWEPTRGDVRRLCRALGVELKRTDNAT